MSEIRGHLWSTDFLPELMLGLENLRAHKLRSLLTMLGMIFGVAAVVAMLSIGAGAQQEVMAFIEQLGVRNLIVEAREARRRPGAAEGPAAVGRAVVQGPARHPGEPRRHHRGHRAQAVHADQAVAAARSAATCRWSTASVPSYAAIGNLRMASGRFFDERGDDVGRAGGGARRGGGGGAVRRRRSGRPIREGQRAVAPGDRRRRPAADRAVRRRRPAGAGSQQPRLRAALLVDLPPRGRPELAGRTRSTASTCR